MRRVATAAAALGMVLSGFAYGQQPVSPQAKQTAKPSAGPVKMTDAQMDTVTAAGPSLIEVDVVVTRNEIVKNTQVGVSAAIAVLGVAGSALRQTQIP